MDDPIRHFEQKIEQAKQSKAAFINFINEMDLFQVMPNLKLLLEKTWTDSMSKIFFTTYWHGSVDMVSLWAGGEFLPSIVDDIEDCIDAMGAVGV